MYTRERGCTIDRHWLNDRRVSTLLPFTETYLFFWHSLIYSYKFLNWKYYTFHLNKISKCNYYLYDYSKKLKVYILSTVIVIRYFLFLPISRLVICWLNTTDGNLSSSLVNQNVSLFIFIFNVISSILDN